MTRYYEYDHRLGLLGPEGRAWRGPQRGALAAVVAHWSRTYGLSSLVSLPTGTGKTAVAMAAPYLMEEPPRRVLVLVPSTSVRAQITDAFDEQGVLRRLGLLRSPEDVSPSVLALTGRVDRWTDLEEHDVVVALPHSISPKYYEDETAGLPPEDLFDLIVVDEAHHTPATTWQAVLDHFAWRRSLLLTATPRRRDRKQVPGDLIYYYPLRRALDEGLYNPVQPDLLDPPEPFSRTEADRLIAHRVVQLKEQGEHESSTVIIRGATVQRLLDLRDLYRELGVGVEALHNRLGDSTKQEIIDRLRDGSLPAVAVAGMLGEGFDLPSIRIAAYHDKHKSAPATIQLIGRLARVSEEFPQQSRLVTVTDQDVYPALKGVIRDLYNNEDPDWSEVLPGLIDEHIEAQRRRARFVAPFRTAQDTPVDLKALTPLMRVIVYEVPDQDYTPFFVRDQLPGELDVGRSFAGGRVAYAGTRPDRGLLVVISEHQDQPLWSSDVAVAAHAYEPHLVAYRPASESHPGLLFLNSGQSRAKQALVALLQLPEGSSLLDPDRINEYLDSLDRSSVSAVGVRTTTVAGQRGTNYRNFLGPRVEQGLRRSDVAGAALGHVNLQYVGSDGTSASGGAAMEKAKLWVTKYVSLVDYDDWINTLTSGLRGGEPGSLERLLPGVDRGHRLSRWPDSDPVAAEMDTELWGLDLQVEHSTGDRIPFEDVLLYVTADPLGILEGQSRTRDFLPAVAITEVNGEHRSVWRGHLLSSGDVASDDPVVVHRGEQTFNFAGLLRERPPTIYFLNGTTTVGTTQYDSREAFPTFNPRQLVDHTWNGVDITAETRETAVSRANDTISVHEGLEDWLLDRPARGDHRWLLCNDGRGEIADYLLMEEALSGELHLGLWHAKASGRSSPGLRIKDLQEVVAQAVRSRLHFSREDLWASVAKRLDGRETPEAIPAQGSDDISLLRARLGLDPDWTASTWQEATPRIIPEIGIAQPGVTKTGLIEAAHSGAAGSFLQLLSVALDAAEHVSGSLSVLVSE